MPQDIPLKPGDIGESAMLSLCAGGLLRTWTDSGPPRLWSVVESDQLRGIQGTGVIGRTLREERRFREAALLYAETGVLMVLTRFPTRDDGESVQVEANWFKLGPADEVKGSVYDDVRTVLAQAIRHALANNEFLVVEKGGWDAPTEPFCLHIVVAEGDDLVSVIETAPEPHSSELWGPHIVPGRESATLKAPASQGTIDVVPIVMMNAIATWGLEPWDLALTFGKR